MFDQFLNEVCHRDPNSLVQVVDFIGAFRAFCVQHGHKPPERSTIIAALTAAGFEIGKTYDRRQAIIGLSFSNLPRYEIVDGKIVTRVAK